MIVTLFNKKERYPIHIRIILLFFFFCFSFISPLQVLAQDGCTQAPIGTSVLGAIGSAAVGTNPIAAQAQTAAAIQATICQPLPRIKIPGLEFTSAEQLAENMFTDTDGSTYLFIPFLGEYISAVYRYGIAAAGVFVVIVLIVSGIQWIFGGASPDNIDAAKERIKHAMTGLFIIATTYTFLYIINPELTSFKSLKIELMREIHIPAPLENDDPYPIYNGSTTGIPASSGGSTRICNSLETCRPICSQPSETWPTIPAQGIAPTQDTIRVPTIEGLSAQSNVRILPALVKPLRLAAQEALRRGYTLRIVSGHRPIEDQLRLACPRILNGTHKPSNVAWPGGSNHGRGVAVDIFLQDSSGSDELSHCCDSSEQNKPQYHQYNRILAEIMYRAGWKRLKSEVWHFEYPNTPLESTRTTNCYETSSC